MADVLNRTTKLMVFSVNTPNYPVADWIINPVLTGLFDRSTFTYTVPLKYWKIAGDVVSTMTQVEKDSVDATGLPAYKTVKFTAIDLRTDQLISAGFTFSTKQFSLSANAQARLMGINQVRTDAAITYPIRWNTIDDLDYYDVPDAATVLSFYLTAVGTYRGHVDSGTALKDSVRAAATMAAVDAVVDTR